MQLRKLVLHGFKSFADRTEFVFDAPITGIVGPNGCGKSNVVDAFKWVLGEQSAKSLRGDAMLDVIFNGAASRKPSGMAEVVLVFDNPKREDGSRVLALEADDVSVGRRLYRDGTSEYTLNNKTSRLKDIRELFLDTGVGVDAYSVIEQGRVAMLLDANPQERRLIFEEAAGISKFKQRKKEAQRKLEKVDQNLLRVTDIVDEVERRLRGVRVQAGRARVYQEHNTRLSELRLEFALKEYHTFVTELGEVEVAGADARFRLDDSATELSRATGTLTEKQESEQAATGARQRAEYALVEVASKLDQARQTEQFASRQIAQIGEQLRALEEEGIVSGERLATAKESLRVEGERLATLTGEVEGRMVEIQRLQEAFKQGQLKLNSLTQEQDKQKGIVLDAMRRHAQASSRLGAIEIERKNAAAMQTRQAERRRTLVAELEGHELKRTEVDERLKQAIADIASRQGEAEAAKAESQLLGKQLAALSEQVSSAKEYRSALGGRQKVLHDLEQRQQGVSEGVKSVLRRRESEFPFVRGLVADVMRVDIEHARVIEAALDGRDQWLVVTSLGEGLNSAVSFSKLEGRVNFVSSEPLDISAFDRRCVLDSGIASVSAVPMELLAGGSGELEGHATDVLTGDVGVAAVAVPEENSAPAAFYIRHPSSDINHYSEELANSPVPVRIALDLVRFEPEFGPVARRLLSRVAIVDDLLAAEHLRQHGPSGWRYVTKKGEVLDTDGTFHAGPPTAAMGLLSRRSELEQLAAQISDCDRQIAMLSAELSGASAAAKEVEQRVSDLRNAVYQANTRKVEASSALSQINDRIGLLKREQPLLDRELEALLDQQGKLASEEQMLVLRRGEIEAVQAAAQQAADAAVEQHKALGEELRTDGEKLAQARVAIAEFQQRQIASRQAESRLAGEVGQLSQQITRVEQQITQLRDQRGEVERELTTAKQRQEVLAQQQADLKVEAAALAERVKALTAEVREAYAAVTTAREAHAAVEAELSKLAIRESELRVRLETVVTRTREELQLDLPARYEALCNPHAAPQLPAPEAVDADSTQLLLAGGEEAPVASQDASEESIVEAPAAPQRITYQPAEKDWDAVAKEIGELREKIQRLGNVNLDAISEQDELEQRSTFLAKEVTDLRDAKLMLEKLIEEINAESSVRFQTTFESVREHFQGMFRKLFGGGKADLFLETELEPKQQTITITHPDGTTTTEAAPMVKVDPLDAGIEVIARPPGKQPVSISQLSGGEKTMTCVALLLSIFKSKPSPFCILDEVDAALDEANNQRFNLIVQEFLDQSQFIIITHSKRTMTIADQLYGITQQEQGVSKRVAVKFDQVGRDGRIDASAVKEQEKVDATATLEPVS